MVRQEPAKADVMLSLASHPLFDANLIDSPE